jgi:hypothetical protein
MSGVEIVILGVGISIWIAGIMCAASVISVGVIASTTIIRAIQERAHKKYKKYYHHIYTPATGDPTFEIIYKNLVRCLIVHSKDAKYVTPVAVDASYFQNVKTPTATISFAVCVIVLTDTPAQWFPSKLRILFNSNGNSITIMTKKPESMTKYVNLLKSPYFNPSSLTFVESDNDVGKMQ